MQSDAGSEEAALEVWVRDAARASLDARVVRIDWLKGGLGLRRFGRVHLQDGSTLVARIDRGEDPRGRPTGRAPEPPLEPIRALLEREGLPVPARLGADPSHGIELLEDFGSESLTTAARRLPGEARRALYEQACDLVPAFQRIVDPGDVGAFQRRLDAPLCAYKADLFVTWSLAQRGHPASAAERSCVEQAFARIATLAAQAPQRLAHRDLQSANVHVIDRDGRSGLGLIDLQGAFLAPPEYDLVCLLRDSYIELPADEIASHLERIRPRLPDAPDPETFEHRFDLLTLCRKGKDHARFLYAAAERGEEQHLADVPTTVRHLKAAALRAARRDPAFGALADLVHSLPESACAR